MSETKKKLFLPHTPLGWVVTVVLGVIALFFSMYPLARVTGGRFGIVFVGGYSLHSIAPYGSSAVVLPLTPQEGQIVSAWAPEGVDDPEIDEDRQPGPVLKVLRGDRLVSTDYNQTVSNFEVRGVVVAVLPPLPWMRGEKAELEAAKRSPRPKPSLLPQDLLTGEEMAVLGREVGHTATFSLPCSDTDEDGNTSWKSEVILEVPPSAGILLVSWSGYGGFVEIGQSKFWLDESGRGDWLAIRAGAEGVRIGVLPQPNSLSFTFFRVTYYDGG